MVKTNILSDLSAAVKEISWQYNNLQILRMATPKG